MKNFRQEIYTEITGNHEGISFGSNLLSSFLRKAKDEKIAFIKETSEMLRNRNDRYAGNNTPYRYLIGDIEAKRILRAILNKEDYAGARACYDSLEDTKEWE